MTQLVMVPDSSEEEQKAKGKKGKKGKKVAVKKEAKEPTLEGIHQEKPTCLAKLLHAKICLTRRS